MSMNWAQAHDKAEKQSKRERIDVYIMRSLEEGMFVSTEKKANATLIGTYRNGRYIPADSQAD